jgi:hypothetical protein
VRSPDLRRRYFLRGTKRYAHKVFRNAILCWGSLKKRLCRGIVFQVGTQEVQCVERNPGMTRVGVIPSVIGYLIFRKALRALPALAVNLVFYAWVVWLCVVFPRALHGKERVLAIGWALSLLLSLIQGLVSASLAAFIQYVRAASIMVALFAAVAILIEGSAGGNSAPDSNVPE